MRQSVKLWLEALESGKFAQTKGALENSEGNCCLGVACRVYEKEFPEKINIETGDDGRIFFNKEGAVLPDEVKNWIGLYSSSGKYARGNLVHQNDSGTSFKEIAQIIRDNAKDLFVDGEL